MSLFTGFKYCLNVPGTRTLVSTLSSGWSFGETYPLSFSSLQVHRNTCLQSIINCSGTMLFFLWQAGTKILINVHKLYKVWTSARNI